MYRGPSPAHGSELVCKKCMGIPLLILQRGHSRCCTCCICGKRLVTQSTAWRLYPAAHATALQRSRFIRRAQWRHGSLASACVQVQVSMVLGCLWCAGLLVVGGVSSLNCSQLRCCILLLRCVELMHWLYVVSSPQPRWVDQGSAGSVRQVMKTVCRCGRNDASPAIVLFAGFAWLIVLCTLMVAVPRSLCSLAIAARTAFS
jgi:hypothetical protein